MKQLITFILTLLLIQTSAKGQNFWQKLNAPSGGYISALSKDSSGNIYAGTTRAGIYRSSDEGGSWTRITNGLKNNRVIAIAYADNFVFMGSNKGGAYRSSDNGNNWSEINNGLSGDALTVNAFAADIYNIYAGTNSGVYASGNRGDNWNLLSGMPSAGVTSMAVGNGYLYVTTYGQGLYLSGDHGASFAQANNGLSRSALNMKSLLINSSYTFIGTDGDGVYRSPNNGQNWTQIINGMSKLRVFSLAEDGTYIYAGTNDGVFRSSDNGDNWSRLNNGITGPYGDALLNDSGFLFAGTNEGVFRSSDHGTNFQKSSSGMSGVNILTLETTSQYIFAGANGGALRSSDGGNTWENIDNGLTYVRLFSLLINGNNLFAGSDGGGVFRSSDNGSSWSRVTKDLNDYGNALARKEEFIFVGTNHGVYRSSDNGDNWIKTSNNLTVDGILSFAVNSSFIYAGTSRGVFRSSNNGDSWTNANNGMPTSEVSTMLINGSYVYAGISGEGVFRSGDNGRSWTKINNGSDISNVTKLTAGYGTIYAGTDGSGVYMSTNNGDSWTQINSGFLNQHMTTIEAGQDTYLYAVSFDPSSKNGIGIYRSNNSLIPSIKVTAPKQADSWKGGSTQTVTWTSANISGNVNIKLSFDGGTTFPASLALNTANDNSESVFVPDTSSSQCRIRIESADDNTVYAINDGNFTIVGQASIKVTSPIAGANWTIGSTQSVTWTSRNFNGNVNIRLSTDAGNDFSTVLKSNTENDGTEKINVPDKASNSCRIKIESVSDTSINALNPGNFAISSRPSITVTDPAAGAKWITGSSRVVRWTSVNVEGNVNIKLSTDGGNTFNKFIDNTQNDSSETVTVPEFSSADCRIRVESVNDTSVKGLNPGNFSIAAKPSINVTLPQAGSGWIVGTTEKVTWTGTNLTGNVNILLSTDGGVNFSNTLKANTPNDSSESVIVPDLPSTDCRVMVQSVSDTSIKGLNPGKFSILPKPRILVTAPLAQDKWTIGSQQTVTWTSSSLSGNVNIKLSTNGGNSYSILVSNSQGAGSEKVNVPAKPSSECRIKVESVNDTTTFGLNPGNFTITSKPTLTVTSPQEGANWTIGSKQTITWKSNGVNGNVNIRLSTDGGASFPEAQILASNSANDSSETITVPNYPSANCRILIESVSDTSVKGVSPGDFTITAKPTITVTSPKTGASWAVGSVQKVKWVNFNVNGNVNIKLSSDGGNTFSPLLNNTPNADSAEVTVPSNSSSICRVKVESVSDTSIYGLNPGNFSITEKPNIIITAPGAGTEWEVGASIVVTWVPVNVSGNINIKLSTDGGSSFFDLLANTANDGSETIKVPDKPSANCKLKIESVSDTTIYAVTQGSFAIVGAAAKLTILGPQPGAVWLVGNPQEVKWSSFNVSGNINIWLSTDGGGKFNIPLASNIQNDQSETIVVPNNPSVTCRLRIESVSDTSISGINSGNFTIVNYPASVTLNNTYSFEDVKDINNYKIIGIPGRALIPVVMSGDFPYDWNVYWDTGTEKDYLIDSSSYMFSPGRAFWILSKAPLSISQTVNTVSLNEPDFSYSIPLHPGWNLISNPFDKSIKWQSVAVLNKLLQNQILYSWNGTGGYSNPSDMKPYEGFYFNNTSENLLTSLKIPYDVSGSALKASSNLKKSSEAGCLQEYPVDIKKFLCIRLTSGKDEVSEVFIGLNSGSKDAFDEYDFYAAPGDFQNAGIHIIKPELPERNRYLYIEQRPRIGEGQKYTLEIKTLPGHPVTLSTGGLENFAGCNIFLLDETTRNFTDLKKTRELRLNLAHKLNPFSLYVGSDEYIAKVKQSIPPLSCELFQNYPNPFNPATTIRFSLPEADKVTLKIYDILGKLVAILMNEQPFEPGSYEVSFNGAELSSGVYIMKMDSRKFSMQRKMLLLK